MSVYIIAEIAQGYEGRAEQASLLVRAAASSGADAAKLQLVYADELATPDYEHYPLFRQLEMPDAVWSELKRVSDDRKIDLILDVFGERSLALAVAIRAKAVKVHSTDMCNPGLLTAIADSPIDDVLLSVGGCSLREIDEAIGLIGSRRITLLHGFQGYPTSTSATQISRLATLANRYAGMQSIRLGFADHADPDSVLHEMLPAVALGAGATVFEKHLTLAKSMKLEDYESALNPDEFSKFTTALRECSLAMGKVEDQQEFLGMDEAELLYRTKTRKHVVAKTELKSGAPVSAADIALKRTSAKDAIHDARTVIGRRLRRDLSPDAPVKSADLS